MSHARQLSADPVAHGFQQIGWAVVVDGAYVQEWRILNPNAGVVMTSRNTAARVWNQLELATWFADRVQGRIGEVWESPLDRLICWGDAIPVARRNAAGLPEHA